MRRFSLARTLPILAIAIAVFAFGAYRLRPIEETSSRLARLLEIAGASPHGKRFGLVNFWATWCPPCMEETPSLVDFAKKNQTQFLFISVSEDGAKRELETFLKAFPRLRQTALLVVDADQSVGRLFGVNKLPESFVYEASSGRVLQISGATDWRDPEILSRIETHFSVQK